MMRRLRASRLSSALSSPAAAVRLRFLRLEQAQRLGVVVCGEVVHRRVRLIVVRVAFEGDFLA